MDRLQKCLIVPVHAPKANWLYFFLDSIAAYGGDARAWDFDIVLAVSNAAEQAFFQQMVNDLPFVGRIGVLCIDDYIAGALNAPALRRRLADNAEGCAINLKKMVALHWAMAAGCDWAACIDSDALVCADLAPLFGELEAKYRRGLYLASNNPLAGFSGDEHGLVARIDAATLSLFAGADQAAIRTATADQALRTFFFDIPFYAAADLADFFAYMTATHGSLEAFFCRQSWPSFDHIVFAYWRSLAGRARIVDYGAIGIARKSDLLTGEDLARIDRAYGYCPSWIRLLRKMTDPPGVKALPAVRLLFHSDRMDFA